jgi:hypothetical protein
MGQSALRGDLDRTPDAMTLSFVELRDTARLPEIRFYHRQPDAQGR